MSEYLFTTITGALPQKLTNTSNLITEATFYGFSGFLSGMGRNNTATVYVGLESGRLPIQVATGLSAAFRIDTPDHTLKEDLSNFWIKGTSGNALYVIYN